MKVVFDEIGFLKVVLMKMVLMKVVFDESGF